MSVAEPARLELGPARPRGGCHWVGRMPTLEHGLAHNGAVDTIIYMDMHVVSTSA